MGACLSSMTAPGGKILEETSGGDVQYHEDFLEDKVLGQGEFGVVKLVHPMNEMNESMAVKILNKGLTFKNNTLYAPLSADGIRRECNILRKLNGEHFNLKLYRIYESRSIIYIVTELCSGGHMMEWVSRMKEDLTVEDVSRLSYELLDAVAFCAKKGIIHRDIKPENIMFKTNKSSSELRLIDFGSSSNDDENAAVESNLEHVTFAGSAFYSAPEMFQHLYTSKIDVWSVGVTLYVLVAGFPAESMQKAFNKLQTPRRNLKELPNMPTSLPDSFFEMLDSLMTYHRSKRTCAGDMLNCEFAQLHKEHEKKELDISSVLQEAKSFENGNQNGVTNGSGSGSARNLSRRGMKIHGSVSRHSSYLGYNKFERAVSTLLAAVLSSDQYNRLLETLSAKVSDQSLLLSEKRLKVIKISDLRKELENLGYNRASDMIMKIPNAVMYESFAFRISLLRLFVNNSNMDSSSQGGRKYLRKQNEMLGHSTHGLQAHTNKIKVNVSVKSRSVHGNNVWESWKKGSKKLYLSDNLDSSMHY